MLFLFVGHTLIYQITIKHLTKSNFKNHKVIKTQLWHDGYFLFVSFTQMNYQFLNHHLPSKKSEKQRKSIRLTTKLHSFMF